MSDTTARADGSTRSGTGLSRAVAAGAIVVVTVAAAILVPWALERRQQRRLVDVQAAMYEIGGRLESVREIAGLYPCPGITNVGACEELALAGQAPLPALDPWRNPFVLLVTDDRKHAMLLSSGSDGVFDAELGGPFLRREHWHDCVRLAGEWFQHPRPLRCLDVTDDGASTRIASERATWALHWQSDALAEIRALHATLRQR